MWALRPLSIFNPHTSRVYGVLFCQLLGTTVVGASLRYADAQIYIAQHSWLVWLPLIGSLVSMVALFFKRQSYPANVALLGTFTLFESLAIGSIVTFYDQVIVLQALVITLFVFAVGSRLSLHLLW